MIIPRSSDTIITFLDSSNLFVSCSYSRRFIAGPTLNNSKKKELNFFCKLSLNVVENVAKVGILFYFFF